MIPVTGFEQPLSVEVAYATEERQFLVQVAALPGATLRDALELSGLLQEHPEIRLDLWSVGVWGKKLPLDTKLSAGDRVEVYRPLQLDPRAARIRRGQRS